MKTKNNIVIFTDELSLNTDTESDNYGEYEPDENLVSRFIDLENYCTITYNHIDKISIYWENQFNIDTTLHLVILNNPTVLSGDYLTKILSLAHQGLVIVIYDHDIDDFGYTYLITCRDNIYDQLDERFNIYQSLDGAISYITSEVKPINTVIGIISDKDEYIDHLFDDLLDDLEDSDDNDDSDNNKYDSNNIKHYPLSSKLPKLLMGWVYRVWYMTKSEGPDKDIENPDTEIKDTDSYVRRSIIIKKDDGTSIMYVHIKPSNKVDLSSCASMFDGILIDLNTYYGEFVFTDLKKYSNVKLFISYFDYPIEDGKYDDIAILNIVKNALRFRSICNYNVFDIDLNPYVKIPDYNGIKYANFTFSFNNLMKLCYIDPFKS